MKIDDRMIQYEINKNLPKSVSDGSETVNRKSVPEGREGEAPSGQQDAVVNFSNTSKAAQRISDAIASEPDVRADRVAEMKAKIESGDYQIDHEKVADKLVDSALEDLF